LTIARGLAHTTPSTIVNSDALRREIKKVRDRGWADSFEQAEMNMTALTAPIFSAQGTYEGSIGIFGPCDVVTSNPSPAIVNSVMQAARRISEQLGGYASPRRSVQNGTS
jgi:DNA-binding IclR family transcriptional regulator